MTRARSVERTHCVDALLHDSVAEVVESRALPLLLVVPLVRVPLVVPLLVLVAEVVLEDGMAAPLFLVLRPSTISGYHTTDVKFIDSEEVDALLSAPPDTTTSLLRSPPLEKPTAAWLWVVPAAATATAAAVVVADPPSCAVSKLNNSSFPLCS